MRGVRARMGKMRMRAMNGMKRSVARSGEHGGKEIAKEGEGDGRIEANVSGN